MNLKDDIREGRKLFPGLKLVKSRILEGTLDLTNPKTNQVLETFYIKIAFPFGYPSKKLPIVWELGDKIPRNPDRHVYEDGKFCLATPLDELLICRKEINFSIFLETVLKPFLATQVAISAGWLEGFPQGEYSHGRRGLLESYITYLGLTDISLIIASLKMANSKIRRNEKCFCGSGLKLKKCHLRKLLVLKSMGKVQLEKDLQTIELTLLP